jgi:dihydrolipoamide dehydrogenase
MKYDIAIIGGGPGGYVAAIRASQLGYSVALIEADNLGGICLNWGCIPTKALLKSAEVNHLLHNLEEYGFSADNIKFDFSKIIARSRAVSAKLTGGIAHLMKKNKVAVIKGYGKLNGKGKIAVYTNDKKTDDVEADHIIIATGARARVLPNLEPDGKVVWSYKEAMVPEKQPKTLLVIGSGAIGSEFASFYNGLGTKVVLAEVLDRILPAEDLEISGIAQKAFEAAGIEVKTSCKVAITKRNKDSVDVEINGDAKTFDKVIVAVGVIGNTENLALEATAVKVEKNAIIINEKLETEEEGIYAIGDCAGGPWLAHKASHEGVICVENIAKKDGRYNGYVGKIKRTNIPGCTYTSPQIASVGYTESKAKELGIAYKVGKFPYQANGKAIAIGETTGLIKTITDAATGEILGVHLIGAEATEMLSTFLVAKAGELTADSIAHTMFPHPTLSEMLHEATLAADNKALHI